MGRKARTTDLAKDELYIVKSAEAGGGVDRLLDWSQIANVTYVDQQSVRKYGWEPGYILEACIVNADGSPGNSVWICHAEDLDSCIADASSGVIWVWKM